MPVCSVVSNSLWPHGLYPTRLLYPWGFPGKNTRVGRHFLLQGSSWPRDNPHLLCLLHCRWILYPVSHQGSPRWSMVHINACIAWGVGPSEHTNWGNELPSQGSWSGGNETWPVIIHFLLMTSLGTTSQDHTMENWIRMGMAGLVLIVLLAILAENQLGPQVLHQKDQQDLPDLSWSRQKSQTEWTFILTPKDHQGYS